MQEYQAIIEKFGEPFPTEGRRNPRVNPIFFAAAFQQDTQVKYFHDVGWLKMENGRWHSTSSTAIKIAIRDLILRLMRSTSKSWGVFLFLELSGNSFCTRNLLYSAVYYLRDSM